MDLISFETDVNALLKDGWRLHGDLVVSNPFRTVKPFNPVSNSSDTETYVQALVK